MRYAGSAARNRGTAAHGEDAFSYQVGRSSEDWPRLAQVNSASERTERIYANRRANRTRGGVRGRAEGCKRKSPIQEGLRFT